MPKKRLLAKITSKIQIYLHWKKTKIFTFSSDYKNWQQVRIVEKSIYVGLLTATSEYKFYSCIAFETQFFKGVFYLKQIIIITGWPLGVRSPDQSPALPPTPLLNPALSAGAFRNQRESPLDTEGRNLAKFQMNSHLGKLQVSRKKWKADHKKRYTVNQNSFTSTWRKMNVISN